MTTNQTTREPVLRTGLVAGLALPDARGTRILVDEAGALVLVRHDGERRTLCRANGVTRLSHVPAEAIVARRFSPPAHRGLLLVWSRDQLCAALSLVDVWHDSDNLTDAELRAVTGVDALAESLGLVVEAAGPEEVARARRLRQRHLTPLRDPATRPGWFGPAATLAVVLAFLTWPAAAGGAVWWALVPAAAVTTPLVVRHWQLRRRFRRLATTPLPPDTRTVVHTSPPLPTTANLAETELQVGRHDVVLRTEGAEWWLPGPAAGGISRCLVHPDAVLLTDPRGRVLLPLDREVWGEPGIASLLAACDSVGVETVPAPEPYGGHLSMPAHLGLAGSWPTLERDVDNGAVSSRIPPLVHLASWLLLGGSAAAAVTSPPWGWGALALGLGLVCLCVSSWWTYTAWQRSQRRRVEEA